MGHGQLVPWAVADGGVVGAGRGCEPAAALGARVLSSLSPVQLSTLLRWAPTASVA